MATTDRLAAALEEAAAPDDMVTKARAGHYDYKSQLPMPIMQLVVDAAAAGLAVIAERARGGEFDGTKEEADAWAKTPEAQDIFNQLIGGQP